MYKLYNTLYVLTRLLLEEVKPRTRFATLCARARAYYSDIMLRAERKLIVGYRGREWVMIIKSAILLLKKVKYAVVNLYAQNRIKIVQSVIKMI